MSSKITDPEVLSFIERTEAAYPPNAMALTIAEQRQHYDRMTAIFRQPRPSGIAVEDAAIDGPAGMIRVRRYWPSDPGPVRVIYFHGGGFVVGGLDSHDDICAEISLNCRLEVVSVDYRLCPEDPHPAAYNDAMAATTAFADRPLILTGDSAGANLAAAVALTSTADLLGQVLIYPGLGGDALGLKSYTEREKSPLLDTADIIKYRKIRAGKKADLTDPTFSPLLSQKMAGAPPCFAASAAFDPLRDDGLAYVTALIDAGVAAEAVVEDQLPHGHLRARHLSKRAGAAFDRVCAAISRFAETA